MWWYDVTTGGQLVPQDCQHTSNLIMIVFLLGSELELIVLVYSTIESLPDTDIHHSRSTASFITE